MGPHDTWFHLIPGVRSAEHSLAHAVGNGWIEGSETHSMAHVFMALFILGLLTFLAVRFKGAIANSGDNGVIPADTLNARGVVEVITDAVMGSMVPVMGEKAARQFLPLIGALAFFILFSNLAGLVPGFLPSTDTWNTTMACGAVVFVATHVYGLKVNGIEHVKHLMGPIWWLAWLMLPIEIISHIVRPVSLSLRLMGNMVGDHKVLGIFLTIISVPLLIPVPIMLLGTIVCIVQTLVFCLLSIVYIGMAIEEHHHDEAHAH
ncbi:MAG: F0F1 ATP synthase subunit A [Myxococcales bacterium]|nr:F0F1 ATP synthase subunit A [Myxococcales bacterium]MCB9525025.1 F0F1 ATP synthase subunit A [Myxococcales bacterium]